MIRRALRAFWRVEWAILFVGVVLLVRAVLPEAIRHAIEWQAPQHIDGRVSVGNVDLALLSGRVVLEDVAVFLPETPAPSPSPSATPSPAVSPSGGQGGAESAAEAPPATPPPVISWKRLAVGLRYRPLIHKIVRFYDISFDAPRVALERTKDGGLDILNLIPARTETPAPTPTPTTGEGSGWGIGVDQFVLRDGGVRFNDLAVKGSEPLEVTLPTISVRDIALNPSVYGEPSRLHVELGVDEGRLQVDARLALRENRELGLEANVQAEGLPLRRARLYVPGVGWRELTGMLDTALTYHFDTKGPHEIRGSVTLKDVEVRVRGTEEPRSSWREFTVKVDPVDVLARRAVVSELHLDGAEVRVPTTGDLREYFTGVQTSADEAPPAEPPPPAQGPPPTVATEPPAPPWTWVLTLLRLTDSRVLLIGPDRTLNVGVGLTLNDLTSEGTQPARLQVALAPGGGTLNLEGALRTNPPGFGGTLRIADLAVPELLAVSGRVDPGLLPAARVGTDLTIEAGVRAGGDAPELGAADLRLHGDVSVAQLHAVPSGGAGPDVQVEGLTVSLADVRADGVLAPRGDGTSAGATGGAATGDVTVKGRVTLQNTQVARATPAGLGVRLGGVDLNLDNLQAPGLLKIRADGETSGPAMPVLGTLSASARLALSDVALDNVTAAGMAVGVGSLDLGLDELRLTTPAGSAALTPGRDVFAKGRLTLGRVDVSHLTPDGAAVGVGSLDLGLDEVRLTTPGGSAALTHRQDVFAKGRLALNGVETSQLTPHGTAVRLDSLDLSLDDVVLPGVVSLAAPPVPAGEHPDVAAAPTAEPIEVRGRLALGNVAASALTPQQLAVTLGGVELTLSKLQAPAGLLAPQASTGEGAATGVGLLGDVSLGTRLKLADVRATQPGPTGFSADLKALDLDLPDVQAFGASRVPSQAGARQAGSAGDLRLHGELNLGDLAVAGADPKAFAVGMRSFAVEMKDVLVPGALSTPPAGQGRPMRVALGDVRLDTPTVHVLRSKEGLVLPQFAPPAAAEQAAPPSAPPEQKAAGAGPPLELSVDLFKLQKGNIAFTDRTVSPAFSGGFNPLAVEVKALRYPNLALSGFRLNATSAQEGQIAASGGLSSDSGNLEVKVDKLHLLPFNPYVTSASSYSIGGGELSLTTTATARTGQYAADNKLTLHALDVEGAEGDSLFAQQFGIPLSVALALLRDMNGDIALDIPVDVGQEGVKVGVASVVRSALKTALLGALSSPLKLLGAAVGTGGKVASATPAAIPFRPGRSVPAPGGTKQMEQLAEFMRTRPGIAVTLDTSVTKADVRWLREQDLLAEWGEQGFLSRLLALPQRGTRAAVREALEARANDKEGKLDAEDSAALDQWLNERPPPAPDRLRNLANQRLAAVEKVLHEYGIDSSRVIAHEVMLEPTDDQPMVKLGLGAVGAPG
jgi:hypothetical protein